MTIPSLSKSRPQAPAPGPRTDHGQGQARSQRADFLPRIGGCFYRCGWRCICKYLHMCYVMYVYMHICMCIFTCVYIYIHMYHVYVCAYIHVIIVSSMCMILYMYVCNYLRMRGCAYVRMYCVCTAYVRMYGCLPACLLACLAGWLSVSVCVLFYLSMAPPLGSLAGQIVRKSESRSASYKRPKKEKRVCVCVY